MNLFNSQYGAEIHFLMTIARLMAIPMIVVFFVAQRYSMDGIGLVGVNRWIKNEWGRLRSYEEAVNSVARFQDAGGFSICQICSSIRSISSADS
ncbi:MAG: hypothetical protein R2911_25375 [Caldilineaceae bacterium]